MTGLTVVMVIDVAVVKLMVVMLWWFCVAGHVIGTGDEGLGIVMMGDRFVMGIYCNGIM